MLSADMKLFRPTFSPAFTLIELLVVMLVMAMLILVGVSAMDGGKAYERRVCTNELLGVLDQARSRALIHGRQVAVAIVDPGDVGGEDRCRVGLFQIENWAGLPTGPVLVEQVSRWHFMHHGVVMCSGDVPGVINPRDAPELHWVHGIEDEGMQVHAIIFGAHGDIVYPEGDELVLLRVAEGHYRDGRVEKLKGGRFRAGVENQIRIGRRSGRSYSVLP